MIRIDTEIPEIIVEIEDREYKLAPRTVEVMDRIDAAEKEHVGKPLYRLWLAELEILLGRDACAELFTGGKGENVDRLQAIYAGVSRAFLRKDEELTDEKREKDARDVAAALAPINEMLRGLRAIESRKQPEGQMRAIPRGQ